MSRARLVLMMVISGSRSTTAMAGGSANSTSVASRYLEYATFCAHAGICSMNQNRRPAGIIIAATQQPTITTCIATSVAQRHEVQDHERQHEHERVTPSRAARSPPPAPSPPRRCPRPRRAGRVWHAARSSAITATPNAQLNARIAKPTVNRLLAGPVEKALRRASRTARETRSATDSRCEPRSCRIAPATPRSRGLIRRQRHDRQRDERNRHRRARGIRDAPPGAAVPQADRDHQHGVNLQPDADRQQRAAGGRKPRADGHKPDRAQAARTR